MRIARFLAADGRVLLGEPVGEGRFRPLAGDLFGRLRPLDQEVPATHLLAPLEPVNIFAIGRNYAAHIAETGAQRPERPLVFMKPTTAVTGPEAPIRLPKSAPSQVDFEAELAVIIGRSAREVSPDAARDHILGYTCANDVTARDCQASDKQWPRAKGFDTFCPLGPWIVTADELDPDDLKVVSRLNGELMQSASTKGMMYSVSELVSYLSHQFTLLPGTLILTGTPEGVGFVRQPPVFLAAGDRIEVEVDGIGVLGNPVATAE